MRTSTVAPMRRSRRGNRIEVSTLIDARPAAVWAAVEDIGSHTEWMADAVAIRFTSAQEHGVGTTFECDTAVGPLRMTDRMEVTEWRPRKAMGVRHVGLVSGEGTFRISRARRGRSRFTWTERLVFPWWMGGPIGGVVGTRVMKRIWRKNLRSLKARVEGGPGA